jgi:peptidoglycan/LPS O-acetylase OafA/YrhL
MPEPLNRSQRYMPGLDGLRALAVLAVLFYHLGFGWASGGLLGVGVFFTLSGYLITDLLLGQLATGGARLRKFWLARARRLLPALLLMLAVVAVWVRVAGSATPGFGGDVAAAIFYVSNWQLIFQHVSYFARFGPPSPLNHLWSLAIEEQFYIFWPLLLLVGARLLRGKSRIPGLHPRLAAVTLLLAVASAVEAMVLYRPSLDPSRVYFGTDTRAFELLAGAALAMVWPSKRLRASVTVGARRLLDLIGVVGLTTIALMIWQTNQYSPFLYRGGFVLLSAATVLAVAALVHPATRLGLALGVAPIRWIGVRSYGIYLWHVPILALTTPAGEHRLDLLRAALQVTATICVAAVSWRWVEQPIRHGAIGRIWRRLHSGGWRPQSIPQPGVASLIEMVGLFAVATVALTGVANGVRQSAAATGSPTAVSVTTSSTATTTPAATVKTPTTTVRTADPTSTHTSCSSVIYIGDSTSEGLTSANYLPNPKQRIDARYARVGVAIRHYEISGARSIVETYQGEPNAQDVAQRWKNYGYRGCWVLALGTNDTANVYVGARLGRLARIQRMMSLIGNQPVMWVNVRSLLTSGPYNEQAMQLWDNALLQACHEYKNMRIFDWARLANDRWFSDDGIHYNTPGYAARSRLIAQALANAFPASGRSTGCVVR